MLTIIRTKGKEYMNCLPAIILSQANGMWTKVNRKAAIPPQRNSKSCGWD